MIIFRSLFFLHTIQTWNQNSLVDNDEGGSEKNLENSVGRAAAAVKITPYYTIFNIGKNQFF